MRNKKGFIINEYVKNPHIDLTKLAEDNNIDYSHVTRTIGEYKDMLTVKYPIFCEKSLSEDNIYYLFVAGEEKKIEVDENQVINDVALTDYEKVWLLINKGITY